MIKVILVNGCATAGKDTFINYCKDILGVRAHSISSIDFVKKIAFYCGWNGEKTPKDRKFLSDMKDLLTEWRDVPLKELEYEKGLWEDVLASEGVIDDCALFICVREPKELEKLKDVFSATTIFVSRKEAEEKETSNHADEEVFDYTYDYWILNDGTIDELKETAEFFLETLNLKEKEN